jgi:ribonuclease P/MRP protein subunit POP1
MWQPTFQENITDLGVSDEKIIPDVDLCEKSERMECSCSCRHLWVWIHASAFEEGYANLKLACQKEVHSLL